MEYLFFLLLIILWILYYSFNHYMMVKPSVFFLSVMVFSMAIYLTAFHRWGVSLSFESATIILLSFAVFAIGEGLGIFSLNRYYKKLSVPSEKKSFLSENFFLKKKYLILCFIITLLTIKLSYDHSLELALSMGTNSDNEFLLGSTRRALQSGEKMGIGLGFLNIFTSAISYISFFIFINNWTLNKKKFVYLLLSILALLPSFLFGGRFGLIAYTYNVLMMIAVFVQFHNSWRFQWKFKQIFFLLCTGVLMLFIFLALGTLTGKVNFDDIVSPLQIYIAFPIQGIDYILDNEKVFTESFFGEHIFARLTNLLYRLGILDIQSYIFQPFAYFNGFSANTYSATGDWLATGGILAVIMGQLTIGYIFGLAFNYIRHLKRVNFFAFIYCVFGVVILDRMTAERFFNQLFDFSTIIMFGIAFFLYKLIQREAF